MEGMGRSKENENRKRIGRSKENEIRKRIGRSKENENRKRMGRNKKIKMDEGDSLNQNIYIKYKEKGKIKKHCFG